MAISGRIVYKKYNYHVKADMKSDVFTQVMVAIHMLEKFISPERQAS